MFYKNRKKYNSSKVNLTISFVVHGTLIAAVLYFGARGGIFGEKVKTIVAMRVHEKKAEKPKPPPPEQAKVEQAKPQETPKTVAIAPPKSTPTTTSVAPPPAVVAPDTTVTSFFDDGAKQVVSGDPKAVYKGSVERTLRDHWNKPEDLDDEKFVAEVELTIEQTGQITGYQWLSRSGNTRWDDSVKAALSRTPKISSKPPKDFPTKFKVRFDVEMQQTEPLTQFSGL
jgi:outer membrane biosynthesis protein TonB